MFFGSHNKSLCPKSNIKVSSLLSDEPLLSFRYVPVQVSVTTLKAVRFCASLKAIGVNIFSAPAVRTALDCDKAAHESHLSGQMLAILFIK